MMMKDERKIATAILGKMKKPEVEVEETISTEDEGTIAQKSACEDMISAFEQKDADMLLVAIQNLFDLLGK